MSSIQKSEIKPKAETRGKVPRTIVYPTGEFTIDDVMALNQKVKISRVAFNSRLNSDESKKIITFVRDHKGKMGRPKRVFVLTS